MILLDFQPGAEACSPIDTGFKLDLIGRVLRALAAADIITRPITDEEAFFGLVFPYVWVLPHDHKATLVILAETQYLCGSRSNE